jgi:FlaA1/EpsC-like NDP-sugar epimerase
MGKPVKILDLAKQMIALGFAREGEIEIQFVGARAGEKLHEVLWNEGETVGPTSHPKISRGDARADRRGVAHEELNELETLVDEGDTLELVSRLSHDRPAPVRASAQIRSTPVHPRSAFRAAPSAPLYG